MFHEVRFPTTISYGSSGGPGFSTNIIEVDSGAEQRVQRWEQPKHTYDVAYGVKSLDDIIAIRTFYIARSGCAYGFRYKDFLDFNSSSTGRASVSHTDQLLGVGDGATTVFQLIKKYTNGPSTVTRTITKPVSGTTVIGLAGVLTGSGWTVNTATGQVTFSAAPGVGVNVQAGFEFDVPVAFGKEIDAQLSQQIEGYDAGNISSIPLVEIVDVTQIDGEYPYGGSFTAVIASDYTINLLNGRLQLINATTASRIVSLPDPSALPTGDEIGTIINVGANTFTLKDHLGVTIASMATNTAINLSIGVNSTPTNVWYGT